MSMDWIPGAGLAVAGGVLSWWRGSAVAAERAVALRTELDRMENQLTEYQRETTGELRQAFERMSGLITRIEVVATEQAAFNRVCTKTLEGVVQRLEFQTAQLTQQHADIAVLKSAAEK